MRRALGLALRTLLLLGLIGRALPSCTACPAELTGTAASAVPTAANTFTASAPSSAAASLTLPPSTSFFLRLKANPSTGFSWALHPSSDVRCASAASGSPVCAVQSCAFKAHVHAPGMVGVGGEELWELRTGEAEGEALLALQYQRPWMEETETPSAAWRVRVRKSREDDSREGL